MNWLVLLLTVLQLCYCQQFQTRAEGDDNDPPPTGNVPDNQFQDLRATPDNTWYEDVRNALRDAEVLAQMALAVRPDDPLFVEYFGADPRYYTTIQGASLSLLHSSTVD
jgi:hypothetical protein